MKFKTFLLLFLFSMSPLHSYFYSAVIMQKTEKTVEKTVVLLSDVHQDSVMTRIQQVEVISLVQKLQKKGQTVHVLVEDSASFINPQGYGKSIPASPLSYLDMKCRDYRIDSTNVEFRDSSKKNKHVKKYQGTIKDIKEETDPAVLKKLRAYCLEGEEDYLLDAHIINNRPLLKL